MKCNHFVTGLIATALVVGALATPAAAQVCEPSQIQEALQYLRRASVDLRGTLPTYEEMESVVANGEVDPMLIEQMLDGDDFAYQMRAYHKELLWTNVDTQRLSGAAWSLAAPGGRRGNPAYFVNVRSQRYRGGAVACKDEPAEFDEEGNILTTPHPDIQGAVQEGWVEVNPYWAPDTTVQVCAFDAQAAVTVENPRNPNAPIDCSFTLGNDKCGCGPNLNWCQTRSQGVDTRLEIVRSFTEQLLRFSDEIIRNDRPYTDFLLATDMEINGPLAHYFNHQTRTGGVNFLSFPVQNYDIPNKGFEDKAWTKVERGERHAGVLTMPGYVAKFQTNRARANRFYNAFLCQYFEAPPGGLPASSDVCNEEPNLTERCGCKHCHLTVEPAAAHWGRFSEAGLGAMNDDLFPTFNEVCATPQGARNPLCRFFYLTEAAHPDEEPFVGMLKAYVFADDPMSQNIELGPAALAQQSIDSGEFAKCTTRKMWKHFMGRDALPEDEPTIDALSDEFVASNFSLRELVYTIVTRPEYLEGESFGQKE